MAKQPAFVNAKVVTVFRLRKGQREVDEFTAIPDSFVRNFAKKLLRFKVRMVHGYNDTYEVIIRFVRGSYTYKAEWYNDASKEYPLAWSEWDGLLELYDNDEEDLFAIELQW